MWQRGKCLWAAAVRARRKYFSPLLQEEACSMQENHSSVSRVYESQRAFRTLMKMNRGLWNGHGECPSHLDEYGKVVGVESGHG